MRPQDIVVLLKIIAKGSVEWKMKTLAAELYISPSEISESLKRSVYAELIMPDKKQVLKGALLDFLYYGLKYVFPVRPSSLAKGMPTAHSIPILSQEIDSTEHFVWSFAKGNTRGQSIVPLYPNVPKACQKDQQLYESLALVDAIRIGRIRERKLAFELLEQYLYGKETAAY